MYTKYFTLTCVLMMTVMRLMAQSPADISKDFINKVENEKYEEARQYLEPAFKVKMHPVALHDFWQNLEREAGSFKSIGDPLVKDSMGGKMVRYTATFSNRPMYLDFFFNAQNQIYSLITERAPIVKVLSQKSDSATSTQETADNSNLPSYANPYDYIEKTVQLKSGEYTLPGTITLPKTGSNWPIVLLIADNGTQDRDQTTGPNKPLRDIAIGLAENGVASFRWDKRGYVYKDDFEQHGTELSANAEIVDDAISAIYYVRNLDFINKSKVFIAGLDMGAFLTPMIARHAPYLGGMIMLNANAFPYDITLHNRQRFIGQYKNDPDSAEKLEALDSRLHGILKDSWPVGTPASQLPGNLTLAFWKDIKNYSPAYTASNINMPIFILQGTRDYMVNNEDLSQWKSTLRRHRGVTIKTYPVNHLLQEGKTEIGFDEEYTRPSHVPLYLISDIAEWVKKT